MDENRILRILIDAAKHYREVLMKGKILIIYQNDTTNTVCVELNFEDKNFLHLTGLCGKDISKEQFFERCVNHRLSVNDFMIAPEYIDNIRQKLKALPYLHQLFLNGCKIGITTPKVRDKVRVDFLIGNDKLSIGFKTIGKNYCLNVPKTLFKGNIERYVKSANDIMAVYRSCDEVIYRREDVLLSDLEAYFFKR